MKLSAAPVFLVGATGVGKSAAALELARHFAPRGPVAILAMDAVQVYRGPQIGTSKPTAAERAEFPHGGLDLVNLGASFDVSRYLVHAADFLREQRAAGRRVIAVGGTGLYFRALTQGLCEAPQGPAELRAELRRLTLGELRLRLKQVDAPMLERVDAGNPRRLMRAIEVMETTGRSLRDWQEATPEPLVKDFTAVWIQRDKAELQARIAARIEAMFAAGWIGEVRGLVARHGLDAVRQFPGIGYRKIAELLGGERATEVPGQGRSQMELGNGGDRFADADLAALQRDILVATRQYAKRQLTWFAREPNLQLVTLTRDQAFPPALHAAGPPALL
jgi:tRNA dimethylallyltransferase